MLSNTSRVILNTSVLYAKAIITMAISFVSVPLVLKALGAEDYGLFNLIAGVIAMLSFLNASMTVSTQRFMSVAMGENDERRLNVIFNVGLLLHLLIGLAVIVIFEICAPFMFSGFLNIDPARIPVAEIIYQILIVSTFFTIISVPFNAVLNAYENLTVFAIISIIDSLLKLALALTLIYSPIDRLVYYGMGVAFIAIFTAWAKWVYIRYKYKNFKVNLRQYCDRQTFREMFGFAGWNTLGSVAMIGRNQGMAMILNVFFGTIINAAYGIANQINGLMSYFSSTLQQAINPQLMRSEGMGNRERLLRISFLSSKFSVLIICLPDIPLIIEMPYVTQLWLTTVPENTVIFTQLILMLSIVYQYSSGLMSAIQSVGKIRSYMITMSILILMNLPLSYAMLSHGLPAYYTIVGFIIIEIISLCIRVLYARHLVGMSIRQYMKQVVFQTVFVVGTAALGALLVHHLMPESFFRLVLVCLVYVLIYAVILWFHVLDANQKQYFITLKQRFKK